MKVLHLAPLWLPVSRDSSGGIETYLTALVSALGDLGCRNSIVAPGDSRADAEIIPVTSINLLALMDQEAAWEHVYYQQHQLMLALQHAAEFDVIHSHIGPAAYVISAIRGLCARTIHTQHNPVSSDLEWFVRQHPELLFTAVSKSVARKLWEQGAQRCEVIPNGLDLSLFNFSPRHRGGLVFIGRLEPDKGPDIAVEAALAVGLPLVLAGSIADEQFFEQTVKPFLDSRLVYAGTVDHRTKNALLGESACALLPSRVDEAFGLVAIEAMACGTPVVALANGAAPEIIENGLTGYVAEDADALPARILQALALDRTAIRSRAVERFDIKVVARRFFDLYTRVAQGNGSAG